MSAMRERLARTPPGYRYSIGRILAIYSGLMVTLLLAALDQTIVATALPRIVGDLGGISQYSWVFTAYMLTSTVTVPLYGKLGDAYGRKNLFLFAIVVFLIGSALCGLATSMTQLVVFRAIQGVGGGGIFPLSLAVIGPLFLTNILWFTAISRVGPSRASLFSNMQPLFGVLFALVLLGEHLTRWELVGGVLILCAVLVERSRRPLPEPPGD